MSCGIGGVSTAKPFTEEEADICHRLLTSLTRRGEDAWGYFDGTRVYKEPGSFLDSDKFYTLQDDLLEAKTNLFLCHTRLATKGDPAKNKNNHPFELDPLVFAHNGMLFYSDPYENIWTIETDSFDMLYWIHEQYERLKDTIEAIDQGLDHVVSAYACWLFNYVEEVTYLFRMAHKFCSTVYLQEKKMAIFGSDHRSIMDALELKGWLKPLQRRIQVTFPDIIYEFKNGRIRGIALYTPVYLPWAYAREFERVYGPVVGKYHMPLRVNYY